MSYVSALIDDLADLAKDIEEFHTLDRNPNDRFAECVRCSEGYHAPPELEVSALCHLCAQTVAGDLPGLIARIRALELEMLVESDALMYNFVGEDVDEREGLRQMARRMRAVAECKEVP